MKKKYCVIKDFMDILRSKVIPTFKVQSSVLFMVAIKNVLNMNRVE